MQSIWPSITPQLGSVGIGAGTGKKSGIGMPKDECPHDSLSGDEGPVRDLGRMPVRWRCDECDAVIRQCSAVNGCRCLHLDGHSGDHQCTHGYWLNAGTHLLDGMRRAHPT